MNAKSVKYKVIKLEICRNLRDLITTGAIKAKEGDGAGGKVDFLIPF